MDYPILNFLVCLPITILILIVEIPIVLAILSFSCGKEDGFATNMAGFLLIAYLCTMGFKWAEPAYDYVEERLIPNAHTAEKCVRKEHYIVTHDDLGKDGCHLGVLKMKNQILAVIADMHMQCLKENTEYDCNKFDQSITEITLDMLQRNTVTLDYVFTHPNTVLKYTDTLKGITYDPTKAKSVLP